MKVGKMTLVCMMLFLIIPVINVLGSDEILTRVKIHGGTCTSGLHLILQINNLNFQEKRVEAMKPIDLTWNVKNVTSIKSIRIYDIDGRLDISLEFQLKGISCTSFAIDSNVMRGDAIGIEVEIPIVLQYLEVDFETTDSIGENVKVSAMISGYPVNVTVVQRVNRNVLRLRTEEIYGVLDRWDFKISIEGLGTISGQIEKSGKTWVRSYKTEGPFNKCNVRLINVVGISLFKLTIPILSSKGEVSVLYIKEISTKSSSTLRGGNMTNVNIILLDAKTNEPVNHAKVLINDREFYTTNGSLSCSLPPGVEYNCTILAEGYYAKSFNFKTSIAPQTFNVKLNSKPSILEIIQDRLSVMLLKVKDLWLICLITSILSIITSLTLKNRLLLAIGLSILVLWIISYLFSLGVIPYVLTP